jgi:hypothetical protein
MIVTVVYPHGPSSPSNIETALAIEPNGSTVGYKNVLMKLGVPRFESLDDGGADSPAVM